MKKRLPLVDVGAELTVLSYSAGQDSDALLNMYHHDKTFKRRFAPNRFIAVMSDTGDEHLHTYKALDRAGKFCKEVGIDLYFLTTDIGEANRLKKGVVLNNVNAVKGYHTQAWQTLTHQFKRNNTCGYKRGRKTCTVNLKVNPIYKFLEEWVAREYKVQSGPTKAGLRAFAAQHGKIDMLIGLSSEEAESRTADPTTYPDWMQESIHVRYPLIELDMARGDCQQYVVKLNKLVAFPSNCQRCPYMNVAELLWLFRFATEEYHEWVQMEAAKLLKFADSPVNHTVFSNGKTLPEMLAVAQEKYGHMSDSQLMSHKMNHGHCVKSKY